jgi:hypothetical protein
VQTFRTDGFGKLNSRLSLLGQMRGNDEDYRQIYTTSSSGCGAKVCPM